MFKLILKIYLKALNNIFYFSIEQFNELRYVAYIEF